MVLGRTFEAYRKDFAIFAGLPALSIDNFGTIDKYCSDSVMRNLREGVLMRFFANPFRSGTLAAFVLLLANCNTTAKISSSEVAAEMPKCVEFVFLDHHFDFVRGGKTTRYKPPLRILDNDTVVKPDKNGIYRLPVLPPPDKNLSLRSTIEIENEVMPGFSAPIRTHKGECFTNADFEDGPIKSHFEFFR